LGIGCTAARSAPGSPRSGSRCSARSRPRTGCRCSRRSSCPTASTSCESDRRCCRTSASRSARPSARCRAGSGESGQWGPLRRGATSCSASPRSTRCFVSKAGGPCPARAWTLRWRTTLPWTQMSYPRDLIGHGAKAPDPKWPGGARLALQIVMNYEEGGERSILHGDAESEAFLQEVVGMPVLRRVRNLQVESMYEYGSRAGFWRLMRMFAQRGLKISVFAVAMALERHPDAAAAIVEAGHEVVSHGWRWIDYQFVSEKVERAHMRRAVESLTRLTGSRPLGWYTGRLSPNTRRLVVEEGGF